jgi:endo-1,4-beta-xylanase
VYGSYLAAALQGPGVKAVLTCGVSDRNSWLNKGTRFRPVHPERLQRPLPFDVDYAQKPAFVAMQTSFDGARKR